jgi:hypothetical protein
MDTDAVCWVCSTGFVPGERVTRLPSLGIDVHALCAQSVLESAPSWRDRDDCLDESPEEDTAA